MQASISKGCEQTPFWLNNDTYSILLDSRRSGSAISIIEGFVSAGGGPLWHRHDDADEVFVIIDGQLSVSVETEVFIANAGDVVFVPRNCYHQFRNLSDKPVKMLLIFTPAGFEEFFREAGVPAIKGTTPPRHVHDEAANRHAIMIGGKYQSFVPDFENPDVITDMAPFKPIRDLEEHRTQE